ncbi:MAG: acyl-CoA dehydrogenase [Polyangiaceae bacterium UTPRO1]|jgi:acyl-CoA dehydrogenase|nr:acyl-CoA dehydrogenase family protein [Myxococcales bacterium]OQY66485.1 MAG: acyl-CoA dehydrogenase [Polyangiaceae bacterium UTPRO1]
MERRVFSREHELFREQFKKFCEREITPNVDRWEEQRIVDRDTWKRAGEQGYLCPMLDPKYGGSGVDFGYAAIINEEIVRAGSSGFTAGLHSDIVVPYIDSYGNEAQKERWLPGCAAGDTITAIAMTEPNTGSDLASIKTTAVRDGDSYVINGQKTFISNGILCDLVIVAAKTDPESRHGGVSLIVVENGTAGFEKGRKLNKMGMHSQDTAELHFSDCRVPVGNLLGEEGQGFYYLMEKLQQERLVCAIGAQAGMETVLAETVKYAQERQAFGKPIAKFQNTQFKLAEIATEVEIGRVFVDRLIEEHIKGTPIIKETSMAKWWVTEMCKRNIDLCLQFFGGYGFMEEYQICRAYRDARVQTIFAGTTEIMKIIIAKSMGL